MNAIEIMTKIVIDKALLEQAIDTLGYYASVCGEDDQDTPAKQAQAAHRAALAEPAVEPAAVRYDFDGYGWKYIDNGSGSDWLERGMNWKDHELVYTSLLPPAEVPPLTPLSNKQIDELADKHRALLNGKPYFAWFDYAKAIERLHGITK